MVAAQVNHFGLSLLGFLKDRADELCVLSRPLCASPQLPAVNDVTIEDQLLGAGVLQEMENLPNLAIGGSEVNIREDDCAESNYCFFHAAGGGVGSDGPVWQPYS